MDAYAIGAIVGALVVGLIIGAIPLVFGIIKKKIALAICGFAACLISGILLGALLAAPVCAIFMIFILKKPKEAKED